MPALDKPTLTLFLTVLAAGLVLILIGHVPVVEAAGYVAPFVVVIDKLSNRQH